MLNKPGKKEQNLFYFMQMVLSFGFGLGITIYILGILGGGFLDKHFGTYPYLTFLGIILAVFLSFYSLIRALPPADFKKSDPAAKTAAKDEEE